MGISTLIKIIAGGGRISPKGIAIPIPPPPPPYYPPGQRPAPPPPASPSRDLRDLMNKIRERMKSRESDKSESEECKDEQDCEKCPATRYGAMVFCLAPENINHENVNYQQKHSHLPPSMEWAFHVKNKNPGSLKGKTCQQVRSSQLAITFDGIRKAQCLLIETKGNYNTLLKQRSKAELERMEEEELRNSRYTRGRRQGRRSWSRSRLLNESFVYPLEWKIPIITDKLKTQAKKQIKATNDPRVFLEWYCMQYASAQKIKEDLKEFIDSDKIRSISWVP